MKQKNSLGFTLVELAIVLMVIGLLIGGILKGQELITNARITSVIRQVKSYDAAVITFMDSYGQKPGDMANPSTRLPNCGSAPCSNAGNNDGKIGTVNGAINVENNTAWVHLAAANLISNIDPANYTADLTSTLVPLSPGGYLYPIHYVAAAGSWPQGFSGHQWFCRGNISASPHQAFPVSMLARMDIKADDGHPFKGDLVINSLSCGTSAGATSYTDLTVLCSWLWKAGF